MPTIGLEKCYMAAVNTDTVAALTFGTPAYYEGIKKLLLKPKQSVVKEYAEDQLWDQKVSFDSYDIEVDLFNLTSAQQTTVLGKNTASEGGTYSKSTDSPPYMAILYKAPLDVDGEYRYGVVYKALFELPEENMEGQEGKAKYATPKLKASSQPLKNNKMIAYHVDTTDPNCPVDIDDTWFDAVVVPSADVTPPTVVTTPLDAATDVAVTANMVWTFDEAIDTSKVTSANFFVMKASDGSLVAGALTIDGTSKIVTLDPTASLTAATDYIAICTTNVTDVSGNALAATSITNFTTAA